MDLTLLYFWLTKISLCNCQKLVIIKITYYAIVVNETLRDLNPNVSSVAPLSMCHHIEVWVVETIYLLLTLVITINWCIAINVFTISTDLMEHYLQGRWMIQRPGKGGSSWCFCFCERTASSFWLFRQPQQAQSCFSCGLSLSTLNAPLPPTPQLPAFAPKERWCPPHSIDAFGATFLMPWGPFASQPPRECRESCSTTPHQLICHCESSAQGKGGVCPYAGASFHFISLGSPRRTQWDLFSDKCWWWVERLNVGGLRRQIDAFLLSLVDQIKVIEISPDIAVMRCWSNELPYQPA